MYTGSFSFFFLHFLLNACEMGDVKALITHQMFGAKETIRARCSQEKEKKKEKENIGYSDYLTLCKTWTRFADFS